MLDMKLNNLLSERKSTILKRWFDSVMETYPAETSVFYKKHNKPFTNPVGSTIFHGLEGLFDEILKKKDFETPSPFLDSIIRIRAIQDFTPAQALVFVFIIKKVILEELKSEIMEHRLFDELLAIESRIDDLAVQAFDIYMKYREKLYELRVKELQNLTFRQLQVADRIYKKKHDQKYSGSDVAERKGAIIQ